MIYRYLNITELNIEDISKKVSSERLERAAKFKNETDKKRSIAVEYLLNLMLKECIEKPDMCGILSLRDSKIQFPVTLTYDEKGKPHIYDDSVYFSLSHSGDYVACIISDKPCGIDIERHSEKRDYSKIARRICTDDELSMINNSVEFYSYWTLKESALKAVGLGLALDMKKVEFIPDRESPRRFITNVDGIGYVGEVLDSPEGYSLSYVETL